MTIVQYLGVTEQHMIDEFRHMRGAHFRLSWLQDMYKDLVCEGVYKETAREYMLHLVGCTILAYKSHVYIDVKYMWLFNSLKHFSWAWKCVVLIVLYVSLGEATVFKTRKLAGYMSPFQI